MDRARSNGHVDIVADIQLAIEKARNWQRVTNFVVFLHAGEISY